MLRFRASIWVLVLATAVACRVTSDDCDTAYLCESTCPCGQRCVAGRCVTPSSVDGGERDAAVDAAVEPDAGLSVCERASQAVPNDDCAGIDLTDELVRTGRVVVYGDTTAYEDDLSPSIIATCTGTPEPGADAFHRLDLEAGDRLAAELLPDGGWNAGLYLLDDCSTFAACVGEADTPGGAPESFDRDIGASGTYFLVVDSSEADAAGCYTLTVELAR